MRKQHQGLISLVKTIGPRGLVPSLVALLGFGLIWTTEVQAQEASSDRVDISDIEERYWAPQDTDFEVVQDRIYTKERRPFFSALYGPLINDPYASGNTLALHANYYFSERFGIELQHQISNLDESIFVRTLAERNQGKPDHGWVKSYTGVGFNFVPIYAKMSVMGRRIIYFDMQFTPHLGQTTYEQRFNSGSSTQTAFSYGLDVTQYFFFTSNVAFRMDLKNRWFSEDFVRHQTGESLGSRNTNTTLFMLGVSVYY